MKEYGYVALKFPSGATMNVDIGGNLRGICCGEERYYDYEVHYSDYFIKNCYMGNPNTPQNVRKKMDDWFDMLAAGCSPRQGKVVMISTPVRDIQPEWMREYSCTIGIDFASEPTIVPYRTKQYNNKLSDEFFQFDIIKLNQNN
jgi:hypothetical protein